MTGCAPEVDAVDILILWTDLFINNFRGEPGFECPMATCTCYLCVGRYRLVHLNNEKQLRRAVDPK
jgi:hypothetical protein